MLRDEFEACPSCARALDRVENRLVCPGCRGMLITEAELSRRLAEAANRRIIDDDRAPYALVLKPTKNRYPARACPSCASRLVMYSLAGEPVGRCGRHGIWLDGGQFRSLFERSAPARGRSWSLGKWTPSIGLILVVVLLVIIALVLRVLRALL